MSLVPVESAWYVILTIKNDKNKNKNDNSRCHGKNIADVQLNYSRFTIPGEPLLEPGDGFDSDIEQYRLQRGTKKTENSYAKCQSNNIKFTPPPLILCIRITKDLNYGPWHCVTNVESLSITNLDPPQFLHVVRIMHCPM